MIKLTTKVDLVRILAIFGGLYPFLIVMCWWCQNMFDNCDAEDAPIWCFLTNKKDFDPLSDC